MSDEIENEDLETEQEPSLRDALDDAIEQHDDEPEPKETEDEPEPKANDEQKTHEKQESQAPSDKSGDPTPEPGDSAKPPATWSPKLREQFGKLDPAMQQQINKRESEITQALNSGAEARKMGENLNAMVAPFQSIIAAEGAQDTMSALNGLLNTAAQLRIGSPEQKAQRMAQLIQHYGIDINQLDNAIVGTPQADPQQSKLEQMLEAKLGPVNQLMQNIQQSQQQSQQAQKQSAQDEVSTFEQTAEFLGDVREDMADLLDMAAKRGQKLSLQDAYDKACALNPEISQMLTERQAAERIQGKQNNMLNKRNAASSLHGRQVGKPGQSENMDLRGSISAAWDDLNTN